MRYFIALLDLPPPPLPPPLCFFAIGISPCSNLDTLPAVGLSAQFQGDHFCSKLGAFYGRELDLNKLRDSHLLLEPYLFKTRNIVILKSINEVQVGKGSR